jgi:hypothetical protein
MTIRKLPGKPKKKEKPRILGPLPIKVRRAIKVDILPEVIVSGSFDCDVDDRLVLRKDYLKDVTTSYITVTEINTEEGWLLGWDETQQQWTPRLCLSQSDQFTLKKEK